MLHVDDSSVVEAQSVEIRNLQNEVQELRLRLVAEQKSKENALVQLSNEYGAKIRSLKVPNASNAFHQVESRQRQASEEQPELSGWLTCLAEDSCPQGQA